MLLDERRISNEHRHQDTRLKGQIAGQLAGGGFDVAIRVIALEGDEQVEVRLFVGVTARARAEEGHLEELRGATLPQATHEPASEFEVSGGPGSSGHACAFQTDDGPASGAGVACLACRSCPLYRILAA